MKDEIVRELWESELMMCTNSFNNPDEFVEMRSVLVEQGLMSENEFHRISLVAYMCNLDSENAWKYFSKENPLFCKFDKAENEGVFLTNEGARFLVWQKKYPPHMEREWRGINIQGANAAKSLFEQEEWHLSPKSIANKLQYEIHKSIAIDTLHISQFNKSVFFSIEGFRGRQLISDRFFFQCSESCIIKRNFLFLW